MRTLSLLLAALVLPLAARAQAGGAAPNPLPREVRREVERLWNGPVALRSSGAATIAGGQTVEGNVAIEGGPLTVAGHVTGSIVAVNANVMLQPTAEVNGDILVVGGRLEVNGARVDGQARVYHDSLSYTRDGDFIVATDSAATYTDPWWRRWDRRRSQSWSKFQIASAGAYNRVEGLPINLGPQVQRLTSWGSVRLDAYGVLRTATLFNGDHGDVGHTIRTEVHVGRGRGIGVGGQLFDVVDPVEEWQLSDLETGLASFVFHRDYRDYFNRHGGRVFASAFASQDVRVTAGYSDERWGSRETRDPWTLFRNRDPWRPNPLMDAGRYHLVTTSVRVDTRNDVDRPWAGWFLDARWEHGDGHTTSFAPTSTPRLSDASTTYSRGFVDLRRYNRVSPQAQLNLRVVLGGWLGGDPLPLERRVSVEGTGTLPGFDFRTPPTDADVGTCSLAGAPAGRPAECDRIALGQVEYRGELHLGFTDWEDDLGTAESGRRTRRWFGDWNADGSWVLFADAGRGWQVARGGVAATPFSYKRGEIPPLSTFRTDVGAGLDFGTVGLFVAKAISAPREPANVFIRLRHAF